MPGGGNAYAFDTIAKAQRSFDPGGKIQTTFGDAGDITRILRPADDFSADRQRVEESLMDRINPQLARERGNIEQRLADQGIRYGSQAYHVGDGRLQPAGHRHPVWRHRSGRPRTAAHDGHGGAACRLPEPGAAAGLRPGAGPRQFRQSGAGSAIPAERGAGRLSTMPGWRRIPALDAVGVQRRQCHAQPVYAGAVRSSATSRSTRSRR